ncbi:MAG: energy-coupling factor transporter transmembrane protein EcfT [Desulfobacterales bacterium]|nr:energy-coupling factor transporter transmembrane protein EcfT [Desulfobacterales bacterium]
MKIADIDYYAIYGNSWLHKTPAQYKLIWAFLVLTVALLMNNWAISGLIYLVLLLIILFSSVPKVKIILASFYSLLFVALYLFSIKNLTLNYALLIIFKVLSVSTSFILVIFTTTYIEIFKKLDKILPSTLISVLFLTYRSIFILWTIFEDIQLALRMRGKPSILRPIYSLKILGNAIGHLIIRSIEVSEDMYECLEIRGYSGNLKYLRK